jgi:hypothetical protein
MLPYMTTESPITSETDVEPEEPFASLADEDYTEQNAEAPAYD